MTSTELPLSLGNGGLPILLAPSTDDSIAKAPTSSPPQSPESDMRFRRKKSSASTPNVPTHPIKAMQNAFAESLLEVTNGAISNKPKLRDGDGKSRRERLIGDSRGAAAPAARWRYRPGQKQHELWKLTAQVSFGVYLLLNGLANSNDQVVNILQQHIDEIDEFLEVALEDFAQASADLAERVDYLRIPMENIEIFEQELEDRTYRAELIEGCEKIEHVLARTTVSMRQYEKDIFAGLESTKEFAIYLADQNSGKWRAERPDVVEIYDAMKGNTDGWHNAFMDLESQTKKLNDLRTKLADMVAKMQKMAGEVSRRTWTAIEPFTLPTGDERRPGHNSPAVSPQPSKANMSPEATAASRMSAIASPSPQSVVISTLAKRDSLPPPPEDPFADPAFIVQVDTVSDKGEGEREVGTRDEGIVVSEEGPLYILQPRTYTPQPPEPLPSPMIKDPASSESDNEPETGVETALPSHQSSLRQRVSLKANPPQSIQIPPPNVSNGRPKLDSPAKLEIAPDSAYGSDVDQRNRCNSVSADLSPPTAGQMMPSPRSEQQFYRPVQASPHSPLQQRPHTSHNTPRVASNPSSPHFSHHQRNVPSRVGGASMLSNVTTMTQDKAKAGVRGDRHLKKKRSAFGWIKKAFSLDDEERAAFESRKQIESRNLYYDTRSGQFLDGRRVKS